MVVPRCEKMFGKNNALAGWRTLAGTSRDILQADKICPFGVWREAACGIVENRVPSAHGHPPEVAVRTAHTQVIGHSALANS